MKKVTIQDIADAMGISRNTVSKAINNSDGLADSTREKILQKAIEMGYKQFSYFRTISSVSDSVVRPHLPNRFQGEIVILTAAFLTQSHFASTMLDKLQQELSQLGYTMTLHRVTEENLQHMALPFSFQRDRVKAVICIEMFNYAYDEMVCGLGLPVLFVDCPPKLDGRSLPADQLFMDNTTEIMRFVHDMIRLGKRRIGFIGDYKHCHSFFERYCAFINAMTIANAPVEEDFCILRSTINEEVVEHLANLKELPDVFICANDFIAFDTIRALIAIDKRVPEDVLILGFDDSPESRITPAPLSTIHIHTQAMAFSAVQLLMTRINEPSLDYRIVHTHTDIVLRESTAICDERSN